MQKTQNNVVSIDSLQEQKMLGDYMKSGDRQLQEALAATPDTEASQEAWNKFANGGSGEVLLLPEHASPEAAKIGKVAASNVANILPSNRA